ncbi:aldehyde dehydrogenase [Bacillus sp. REN16]|uniref:aldehyde dehydrogenase n=1 Tax=Bacillus sp. REN16 TaxID=2887296 RepID=UPI001E59ABB8|nr:aldehyde dehydrogenase [Bacillus sp. REN16]MCC3358635.1 aldehyde dehydrogenase [Bacillus sp. REN16]
MESYGVLIKKQREFYFSGKTKEVAFRVEALKTLRNLIRTHEKEIMAALHTDLNKSEFESYTTEIGFVLEELRYTLKHIENWAKPRKVKTGLTGFGSKNYIYPEPYGVVLIISPWNYPFQLAFAPLIGAIAAGNCAILKPSELTPKTSELLTKLVRENFQEEYIAIVEGGAETSTALLNEKTDYIFFTGSIAVGKVIMEAAAKHLTPVTLELGGKSPCIVHKDANLHYAAKRIAWGKYINAGQTCVAPDYVYVHDEVKDAFLKLLTEAIDELYGNALNEKSQFTKIVSERHFQRLKTFIYNSGTIYYGGESEAEKQLIAPTVLSNITWEDPIMEDEIFGPILPVMRYEDILQVINEINMKPKPLALYIFSEVERVQNKVLESISFGGGCVNDTVYHFTSPHLPFGGVGESGIGAYHGKGSFDVFSHEKGIMKQTTRFDLPLRYPTTKYGLKLIKMIMK